MEHCYAALNDGDQFTTADLCNWKKSHVTNVFPADVADRFFSVQ